MLHVTPNDLCFKDIVGHKLATRLRAGMSPTFRALLAHEFESGACWLHSLTRRQACALTGASIGYVHTLAHATEQEREAVKRGVLSLSDIHNRPPSDAAIDRVIARLGPDRVLAALDRLTMPQRCEATADMFAGN
jgi:hypothetical protein